MESVSLHMEEVQKFQIVSVGSRGFHPSTNSGTVEINIEVIK